MSSAVWSSAIVSRTASACFRAPLRAREFPTSSRHRLGGFRRTELKRHESEPCRLRAARWARGMAASGELQGAASPGPSPDLSKRVPFPGLSAGAGPSWRAAGSRHGSRSPPIKEPPALSAPYLLQGGAPVLRRDAFAESVWISKHYDPRPVMPPCGSRGRYRGSGGFAQLSCAGRSTTCRMQVPC